MMSRLAALSSTTRMRGGVFIVAPRGTLWHKLPDFGQQRARVVWFAPLSTAPRRSCLALIAAQGVGRHHDDRNGAQSRVGLDATCCLIAIEQRKLDIHQDQVRPLPCSSSERLFPVFGLDDLVCRPLLENM